MGPNRAELSATEYHPGELRALAIRHASSLSAKFGDAQTELLE